MKNRLEDFIYTRVKNAKKPDVDEILLIFHEKQYEKGELFKERDTIIKKLGFLVEGSARSYFINEKGDEITDVILQKESFLSDIISVRTGEKSPIIIELLEKSIVLTAPMNIVWDLLDHNVTFNILIREYIGDRAMELVKRHLMFLNGTAKERYQYLLTTNPSILEKFPLKYIASMIGVTQTQLSRIRNEKI
jgi:CRP-like cAMP-binding protein